MKDEKLKQFCNDVHMYETVHAVLLQSFLKTVPRDSIHELAAARIAIDLLEDGFREIKKYQNQKSGEPKALAQIGL